MIPTEILEKMRERVRGFTPYRKRVRPAAPTSYPPYVDGELQNISTNLADIRQVIADLDARIAELGG
jgi:hypothetical protein